MVGAAFLVVVHAGSAPAQASPSIEVEPSAELEDGHEVTVTGSGWTPANAVAVSQCSADFRDGQSCDFSSAATANTDGEGGFELTFRVTASITTPNDGPVDCAGDGCLLAASNLTTSGEFSNQVPLSFGGGAGGSTIGTDSADPGRGGSSGDDAEAGDRAAARSDTESDDGANLPLMVGGLAMLITAVLVLVLRRRLAGLARSRGDAG